MGKERWRERPRKKMSSNLTLQHGETCRGNDRQTVDKHGDQHLMAWIIRKRNWISETTCRN